MPLDRDQLTVLLDAVARTQATEIDCDACLAGMAEFAESELVGLALPDAQGRVAEHLAQCAECREEYELLLETLRAAEEA